MVQKTFRLNVSRLPGETSHGFDFRQRNLAANTKGHEADALQIPAHLARLELVSELIRHAFTHGQVAGNEAVRSERQLCNPQTLADWQEVLLHTRQCHRAPAFLNRNETELSEIKNQLNTIAGLLSQHPAMAEFLNADESEVQP
jgi:hypothetical protein